MEQEVEVITIDDSEDDEVEMIEDNVVIEAGRIFWRMEVAENVEEEAGAEIEPIADSDYDSECDGIDYDEHVQIINTADINAMDDDTRMCAIHIYYQLWGGVQT
ncbi:unnamed protein product, partial [Lasius platythorax]